MASRSSPPKSASGADPGAIERLLREGWTIADPDPAALDAAARLERLGLVEIDCREFVRCAEPLDEDFPPPVRDCQGRILLRAGLDEGDDAFRCPDCERPVYPLLYGKRRCAEMRSRVKPEGVAAFLHDELDSLGVVRRLAEGVFRVETGYGEALVCLVELCRDPRYLSRDHARMHPTLFVAIDARNLKERFLPDPWLVRATLADVVTGSTELPALLDDLLARETPSTLVNASLPVYDKVVPALLPSPASGPQRRQFMVEFASDRLLVEDAVVATAKAGMQLQVFGILWRRFLEDLAAGRSPDDFRPISLKELTNVIDPGDKSEAIDEMNVRRAINRLQQDLSETVRRELGLPLGREDIIQNLRDGQRRRGNGYRINPRMVLPRVSSPS
ncbi:MAG: hypothetical protein HQL66_02075 [Magnetococcales bacterium]|nr:hypothetical protein [Magnetococcales bacterium]